MYATNLHVLGMLKEKGVRVTRALKRSVSWELFGCMLGGSVKNDGFICTTLT